MPDYPYMDESERLSKYRDNMMSIKQTGMSGHSTSNHKPAPINQDIEETDLQKEIRYRVEQEYAKYHNNVTFNWNGLNYWVDQIVYKLSDTIDSTLAQRETDLLTYLSDLYGLPLKELQRNVELWRNE